MPSLPARESPRAILDVVTVPDFGGTRRDRFEARTLLFLACWLEFSGQARAFPLRLACIGEPPRSVRWLADRCGADVHVCAPILLGRFRGLNKLRGLEIAPGLGRRLLLDTDVLVLSDFSDVAAAGAGIGASSAFKARVPEEYWKAIYHAVGVTMPTRRVTSIVGRLDAGYAERPDYPSQTSESRRMLPYYNGGVLLVPGDSPLRASWEAHARTIAALFGPDAPARRAVAESDQAGLATALADLEARGAPVAELPDRLHATWLHVYRRALALRDVALFHAFGLFGRTHRMDQSVSFHIDHYIYQVTRRFATTWRRDPRGSLRPSTCGTYFVPAVLDALRLRQKLRLAYRKHVRPALDAGGRRHGR